MSAVPEIQEQPHPSEGDHRPAPAAPRRRGIRWLGGGIGGGVLAVILLTGIAPRVAHTTGSPLPPRPSVSACPR